MLAFRLLAAISLAHIRTPIHIYIRTWIIISVLSRWMRLAPQRFSLSWFFLSRVIDIHACFCGREKKMHVENSSSISIWRTCAFSEIERLNEVNGPSKVCACMPFRENLRVASTTTNGSMCSVYIELYGFCALYLRSSYIIWLLLALWLCCDDAVSMQQRFFISKKFAFIWVRLSDNGWAFLCDIAL